MTIRWTFAALPGALCAAFLAAGQDPEPVTYAKDIAPVFAAKCVSCHSPEGSGPFSLENYEDVRRRASLVREVAMLQKMPPLFAESDFGRVARHAPLTDLDILKLQEWVRQGTPRGAASLAPAPKKLAWSLGEPNLILKTSTAISVSAEGAEAVRTVTLDLPLDAERELVAFDVRPRSPQAARQVVVAISRPGLGSAFTLNGVQTRGLIGAWAVGAEPWRLPEDAGYPLRPGDRLQVRALYHPTGKPENGGFDLALYFAHGPRTKRPVWRTLGSNRFEITGKEYFTTLTDSQRLDKAARVVSVFPEARSLAMRMRLASKIGTRETTVLAIPRWDKRWIAAYNFPDAPRLPQGAELLGEIQYDNANHGDPSLTLDEVKRLPPNPSVFFGPKETDELFWIHVQLLIDP
jgi:hypothetical protein